MNKIEEGSPVSSMMIAQTTVSTNITARATQMADTRRLNGIEAIHYIPFARQEQRLASAAGI
jgi:hypothetical protein